MAYAENTEVSVERSRLELDAPLSKAGATQRGYLVDDEAGVAIVTFRLEARCVRIEVPLPKLGDFATKPDRGRIGGIRKLTPGEQQKAWEQACRSRWRVLVLSVKAKLELCRVWGRSPVSEFLEGVLLPNGHTVGEELSPLLDAAYASGNMPSLRLGVGERA